MTAVPTLLILLFCHFFADYVVFDRQRQIKDTHNFVHIAKHLLELFCTYIVAAMVTINFGHPLVNVIKFIFWNVVAHGATDIITTSVYNAVIVDRPLIDDEHVTDRRGFWYSIAIDQYLHVGAIVVLWDLFLT